MLVEALTVLQLLRGHLPVRRQRRPPRWTCICPRRPGCGWPERSAWAAQAPAGHQNQGTGAQHHPQAGDARVEPGQHLRALLGPQVRMLGGGLQPPARAQTSIRRQGAVECSVVAGARHQAGQEADADAGPCQRPAAPRDRPPGAARPAPAKTPGSRPRPPASPMPYRPATCRVPKKGPVAVTRLRRAAPLASTSSARNSRAPASGRSPTSSGASAARGGDVDGAPKGHGPGQIRRCPRRTGARPPTGRCRATGPPPGSRWRGPRADLRPDCPLV